MRDLNTKPPRRLTVAEIKRLIEEAGRVPVERDTRCHEVIREGGRWKTGRQLVRIGCVVTRSE